MNLRSILYPSFWRLTSGGISYRQIMAISDQVYRREYDRALGRNQIHLYKSSWYRHLNFDLIEAEFGSVKGHLLRILYLVVLNLSDVVRILRSRHYLGFRIRFDPNASRIFFPVPGRQDVLVLEQENAAPAFVDELIACSVRFPIGNALKLKLQNPYTPFSYILRQESLLLAFRKSGICPKEFCAEEAESPNELALRQYVFENGLAITISFRTLLVFSFCMRYENAKIVYFNSVTGGHLRRSNPNNVVIQRKNASLTLELLNEESIGTKIGYLVPLDSSGTVRRQKAFYDEMIDRIRPLGQKILKRFHPQDLKGRASIEIQHNGPILDYFRELRVLISAVPSTAVYQSILSGIPVIGLDFFKFEQMFQYEELDTPLFMCARSEEELLQLIHCCFSFEKATIHSEVVLLARKQGITVPLFGEHDLCE